MDQEPLVREQIDAARKFLEELEKHLPFQAAFWLKADEDSHWDLYIATDRVRELDALRGDPDEVRARLSEHIPLRRYGEPDEFGRAAAFVLSPAASYITGAMIPVDGGAISSI